MAQLQSRLNENRYAPISRSRLLAAGLWLAALASWAIVLAMPVNWPTSSMPSASAVVAIGPVSARVVPGETLTAAEQTTTIDLLIRVGGPYGSWTPIGLTVYQQVAPAEVIARSGAVAVSGPENLRLTRFELDAPVPGGREVYVELEIPPDNPWPILLGGTRADPQRADAQLYLERQPGWLDQDMFHQLLRRQNLAQRIPVLWSGHRATLLAYVAILATAAVACFGVGMVAGEKRPGLKWPLALTLLPAATAVYYFYLLL